MPGSRVLIVEDDLTLQSALAYNLNKEGYEVIAATDGAQGLALARQKQPDLILLDIMLPVMSGLEVCRILRSESNVSIIMLTARTGETDKVAGLDLGADDYLTKPFGMRELLARIRALLRRGEAGISSTLVLNFGEVNIDPGRHIVTRAGKLLELSHKEFELLAFLAQHKGLVFSREQLLERVWGYDYAGSTRTIDVHVRWLREKIESDPEKPRHLLTVRGAGYKLEG
jgi:two-component system, OmpR family, response regulator